MNNLNEVKQRIDLNLKFAEEYWKQIQTIDDTDKVLDEMSLLGKFLAMFVTGVYASEELEKKVIEIGNKEIGGDAKRPDNNKTLFVMTEVSNGGGHTVLASNYIRWDEEEECSLVVTRMENQNIPSFLKESVYASGGEIYYLKGKILEKARQLKNISTNYSKIILMQHPEDIIPDLVYGNNAWEIPVYMYLHANFSFSYGFMVADKVLTLNTYDIDKAIRYRGIQSDRLKYFQFPNDGRLLSNDRKELTDEIDDTYMKDVVDRYGIDLNKKIVVTMADGFKLEDIVGCSFRGFAKELVLSRDDIQYVIIGPDKNSPAWNHLMKETESQITVVGYIKRKDACAIIKMASLYIVSFPMSASGNMIAEAYGVPFLTYALTERGRERQDVRTIVYSIEELKKKANDILDGNCSKYLLGEKENIIPKEDWKREWQEICLETPVKHQIYSLNANTLIEDEELINCQLMQLRAEDEVKYYSRQAFLKIDSINFLNKIGNKYNINIVSDKCAILIQGHSIAEYFYEHEINCIAIYGAAVMGKNLYFDLVKSDIEIECFIDRNTRLKNTPIKLIDINSVPQKAKVIVNTALGNEAIIRDGYTALTSNIEFISLFDIIDKLYEKYAE